MHHTEKLLQRLVFGRIELPQIECPSSAQKDSAGEHNLDHVDKLDLLVHHVFDLVLKSCQLCRFAPGQALLFPRGEPHGDSGGGRHPIGIAWLGDLEPP